MSNIVDIDKEICDLSSSINAKLDLIKMTATRDLEAVLDKALIGIQLAFEQVSRAPGVHPRHYLNDELLEAHVAASLEKLQVAFDKHTNATPRHTAGKCCNPGSQKKAQVK